MEVCYSCFDVHATLIPCELFIYFIQHTGVSATAAMLRTALISMTCVLVVMSVSIFIIGFVCGHYFSQRLRKSADKNKQSASQNHKIMELDLELKENMAYITVRPTT